MALGIFSKQLAINRIARTTVFKAAPNINTEIKDVGVTCNNPLADMRSHTTAAVLQYVELYSLLVIPAVEHVNEALCAWEETESALVHMVHKETSRTKGTTLYKTVWIERNDNQM